MTFLFDWISWLFKEFVFIISSLVILYGDNYIPGNLSFFRFIMLVFIFFVSMKFLNFSPNVVSVLLSWDGLGLVSRCLAIYYQSVRSSGVGMLTVFSNRIGERLLGFCVPRWSLVK
jgi:NADH-ubiquinone oxidoreductase chain 5